MPRRRPAARGLPEGPFPLGTAAGPSIVAGTAHRLERAPDRPPSSPGAERSCYRCAVRERIRDLIRRLREAGPAVRVVLGDRSLTKRWLLGARRAQVVLGLTLVVGLFVFPPVRDALIDAVLPVERTRGGFLGLSTRTREHPAAGPTRGVLTFLFWAGGLGATAGLLVLRARQVAGRPGREPAPGPSAGHTAVMASGNDGAGLGAAATQLHPSTSGEAVSGAASSSGPAASTVGAPAASAGRYAVREELGRGGMGVVYRAKDTVLEREVALKELPSRLVRDPHLAERFRTEARVLARLTHAGMVQVFDLVENETGMWIAMELVPGGSLDHRLDEARPSLDESLSLAADMADALAHAHAQGVVHRDFKPHNVLLTPEGRPKIMDFGLAKIAREGPKLTQVGAIMGSPAYMSPEQASGGEADQRADVYAFGVTLFQMVVGRCPFEGDTPSVLAAHITQEPPDPVSLGVEVPPELSDLLRSLLAKSPDDRPTDLAKVAVQLRGIQAARAAAPS